MGLEGKKILVTGADGFIGSHLTEALVLCGAQVRAFTLYNAQNSWGCLDQIPSEIKSSIEVVSGDIRDYWTIQNAAANCDIVFHLAALIAIPYSYQAPDSYVATNIQGTLNVLKASKEQRISKVMITSTSEVYGTARYVPIDESHPFQGQSPYAASKIGADRMAEAFFRSYGLPVTIVRPFNTYGPRQSARAVIPTIIVQLLSGRESVQLGNLLSSRDLVFVNDTVEGFIRLAQAPDAQGHEVNIATQTEITIGDLAVEICRQINPCAEIRRDESRFRPASSEVDRLLGANKKLSQITGWTPSTPLKKGLKKTIEWFREPENLKPYKAELYNI
jgi:NAD dependent epimerase/dehydratase